MLVVLPPSETKVSGGPIGTQLGLSSLKTPELTPLREELLRSLARLCEDREAALEALKLGPKGASEVERNREVRTSPVLPALERYTGVLYDALEVTKWTTKQWVYARAHVGVFSALFGLIGAQDLIPAYRLSADSKLDVGRLPAVYEPYREAVWGSVSEFVLDLRSGGYRSLAPLTEGSGVFVSLVKPGPMGARKALGHHNKAVKGRLVADLVRSEAEISSLENLVAWGAENGWDFDAESYQDGVIDLVVAVDR
jgi:cytoplasmic iron level regulating protein YaaA (DUF328/UPF0246 family)